MRIFLAGIMQGSMTESGMHTQDYRAHLKTLLQGLYPDAEVYDPLANHTESIKYGDRQGKDVFLFHNYMCREMDVLVAFVPEASMGTAIEMWEAWQNGAMVVAISPMHKNWAVRFLSHRLFHTLEEFETALRSGDLALARPEGNPESPAIS